MRAMRPPTTRKISATELCFRTMLARLSRKRTSGLAMSARIHPMTKGMKNTSSFGPQKKTT